MTDQRHDERGRGATHLLLLEPHGVRLQGPDQEEGDERRKDGEAAADPERTRVAIDAVGAAERVDHGRECPRADERADLADGGGSAVELAADGGRAELGREEAEAVAGTQLAEGEEDAVEDCEGCDVGAQPADGRVQHKERESHAEGEPTWCRGRS